MPGYDKASWFGLFSPAGVPESAIARVHAAVVKVLQDPEIMRRLSSQGANAVGNPSAEFDAFVRSEINAWGKLIREMKL